MRKNLMDLATEVNLYKTGENLAFNIPDDMLPITETQRWVSKIITTPGIRKLAPGWLYCRIYPHASTFAILSPDVSVEPHQQLLMRSLDPTEPVWLRPYGSNAWFSAHKYHKKIIDIAGESIDTNMYTRATIPVRFPQKYYKNMTPSEKIQWQRAKEKWPGLYDYIRQQEIYPFQIMGSTLPQKEDHGYYETQKEVAETDLQIYNSTYKIDNSQYILPRNLNCYDKLNYCFSNGRMPKAQLYEYEGIIYANFIVPGLDISFLSELQSKNLGSLFRSTSGIQISVKPEFDYDFYFSLKAHFLSLCPSTYTINAYAEPITVLNALEWTVQNLLWSHPSHSIANVGKGLSTGVLLSEGEVSKKQPYIGAEDNQEIDPADARNLMMTDEFKLNYAIKIAEFSTNRTTVGRKKVGEDVQTYPNSLIENTMARAKYIWCDAHGFVWRFKDVAPVFL